MVGHIGHTAADLVHAKQLLLLRQHRMGFSQGDQIFHKSEQLLLALQAAPVQPPCRIVLAVGIVVSLLGVAKFIARQDAGRPLCQQHQKEGISSLPLS